MEHKIEMKGFHQIKHPLYYESLSRRKRENAHQSEQSLFLKEIMAELPKLAGT